MSACLLARNLHFAYKADPNSSTSPYPLHYTCCRLTAAKVLVAGLGRLAAEVGDSSRGGVPVM